MALNRTGAGRFASPAKFNGGDHPRLECVPVVGERYFNREPYRASALGEMLVTRPEYWAASFCT